MFYKNSNIESSPQEIWIRICFLEINGSPSLFITKNLFFLHQKSIIPTFDTLFWDFRITIENSLPAHTNSSLLCTELYPYDSQIWFNKHNKYVLMGEK